MISIQNPHKVSMKYSIVVQSKEITAMTSEEKMYTLIEKDSKNYYEIFVEAPGLLVLRVV